MMSEIEKKNIQLVKDAMDLILVRRGDLLVSGINALKGAVALHPKNAPSDVAATIHYGAYELDEERVLPRYIHE